MPLPLGHTAIGWAAYETAKSSTTHNGQSMRPFSLAQVAFVTLLANLPDLDVLYGLVVHGNGSAIHRGPTHSLLFVLLAGFLGSNLWRLWQRIPRFGFRLCALIVFSHVAADMLLTDAPVSLLWPLELNYIPGHNGWGQVVHMILFKSIQDIGIVMACLIYSVAMRLFRGKTPVYSLFAFARRRVK